MLDGIRQRWALRNAPEIPYHALNGGGLEDLRGFAHGLPLHFREKFWKGTKPAALERADALRGLDFVVSDPTWFGAWPERYGEHAHIFPKGYDLTDNNLHDAFVHDCIGILDLWNYGGFDEEPLCVTYRTGREWNEAQVDAAFDFREVLDMEGIPYGEAPSRDEAQAWKGSLVA
ncbi:hypothetical protein CMI48_00020 [Candidatus Pacearchaeota archaeon]|nr:hypothetical protein [Candidatus Pacearchaeota archaeon]